MTNFNDFLKNLNLENNPFSFFTTENELKQSVDIFTPVNDYESILSNFSSDNSLIILGDRGAGKTALLKNLESLMALLHKPISKGLFHNIILK